MEISTHCESSCLGSGIRVETFDAKYIVSKPSVGAVSVFGPIELTAFHLFLCNPHDSKPILDLFQSTGFDLVSASEETVRFLNELNRDGWSRNEAPTPVVERLQHVYFTITRECNLACPYCYQGISGRRGKTMCLQDALLALNKISRFNPNCHIIITGGEPFEHSNIFEILEEIENLKLPFEILCNGTHIDQSVADRLASYELLRRVQISLDGYTEATHALTRGRDSFTKAINAIEILLKHGVPLMVAPTIHNGNVHEMPDLAVYAATKGAYFCPNNLRVFPHDDNNGKLSLDNERLSQVIQEIKQRLEECFESSYLHEIASRTKGTTACSVVTPNANFICGTGHSLLDIDWNGDVYPCHLLKDPSLMLGNIFRQDFSEIFKAVEIKKIRVPSTEIEKCGDCKFNSSCGGGCRAGAFYAYGSTAREDDLCEVNYNTRLPKILQRITF